MSALNLYKIVRNVEHTDYDDTYAAVVIAATPGDAREMARTIDRPGHDGSVWYDKTTSVELLGRAAPLLAGQVVLTQGY